MEPGNNVEVPHRRNRHRSVAKIAGDQIHRDRRFRLRRIKNRQVCRRLQAARVTDLHACEATFFGMETLLVGITRLCLGNFSIVSKSVYIAIAKETRVTTDKQISHLTQRRE